MSHARTLTARASDHPKTLDFLWLETTNRCNLQCSHCYADSSPYSGHRDVMTEAQYLRVIDEGFEAGCSQIQFIGGEPTLNPSLPAMVRRAREAGYTFIEVFTNLVRVDDPLLAMFQAHDVDIATSYYSRHAGTHDRITLSLGSHRRTTTNIARVLAAGLRLRVGVIEMDANRGEFDETAGFLRGMGVTNIGRDIVRGFGRAERCSGTERHEHDDSGMAELCGQCATNTLAIGSDGVAAPCIMSRRWAVGSALDGSLHDILASDGLARTRARIAAVTASRAQAEDDCYPQCGPQNQQCMPECSPSAQCTPCAPNGSYKCQPNAWCSPGR